MVAWELRERKKKWKKKNLYKKCAAEELVKEGNRGKWR